MEKSVPEERGEWKAVKKATEKCEGVFGLFHGEVNYYNVAKASRALIGRRLPEQTTHEYAPQPPCR